MENARSEKGLKRTIVGKSRTGKCRNKFGVKSDGGKCSKGAATFQ